MQNLEDHNRASDPEPSHFATFLEFIGACLISLLFAVCLLASPGCYGTAIDTRSITADEVTITQNTPWSNLTITAKGWHSDVKGQPKISPTPVDDRKSEKDSGVSESSQGKPGVGDSNVEPGGRGTLPQTSSERNTINPKVGASVVGNPAGLPPTP